MSRFAVAPIELESASSSLRAARSDLVASGSHGLGAGTGTGSLEAALSVLATRAEQVARLLDAAAAVTARNLSAGADAYERTDSGAMPERQGQV